MVLHTERPALIWSTSVANVTGWPSCPSVDQVMCSGRGTCSHIGVCSCYRGWGGDDCSHAQCPDRCSGHGRCRSNDVAAACVCDEGYVGFDCALRASPPSPPPALPEPVDLPPTLQISSLSLNVTFRTRFPAARSAHPLSPTLPPLAHIAYWTLDGTPPQALRLLASSSTAPHVMAASALSEVDAGPLAHSYSTDGLSPPVEPLRAPRAVVASAVDWRSGRAYVSMGSSHSRDLRGHSRRSVLQLALPSMTVLASASVGSVGMWELTSLSLGGDAAESLYPPTWLHALLASSSGKAAELAVLHLPDMQTTFSLRFDVPSPVRASYYDPRSSWLYLLCSHPHPRLLRVQMMVVPDLDGTHQPPRAPCDPHPHQLWTPCDPCLAGRAAGRAAWPWRCHEHPLAGRTALAGRIAGEQAAARLCEHTCRRPRCADRRADDRRADQRLTQGPGLPCVLSAQCTHAAERHVCCRCRLTSQPSCRRRRSACVASI